jgi:hypothetical protein
MFERIVYYEENNFTSRIISNDGNIWFNDGIATGSKNIKEGHLSTTTDKDLKNVKVRIWY